MKKRKLRKLGIPPGGGFVKGMQSKSVSKLFKTEKSSQADMKIINEISKDFAAWYKGMRSMKRSLPPAAKLGDAEFRYHFNEYVEFAKSEVEAKRYLELAVKLRDSTMTKLDIRELRKLIAGTTETMKGTTRQLKESLDIAEERLE